MQSVISFAYSLIRFSASPCDLIGEQKKVQKAIAISSDRLW